MASLLSKFRIDYSDLTLIPDITKKPQETSTQFFNELIKDFVVTEKDGENGTSSRATLNEDDGKFTLNYIKLEIFEVNLSIEQYLMFPSIFFSPHNRRWSVGGAGQDESVFAAAGVPAGAVDQVGPRGDDPADATEEHRLRTPLHGLAGEPESGHAALPFCARQSDECADLLLVEGTAAPASRIGLDRIVSDRIGSDLLYSTYTYRHSNSLLSLGERVFYLLEVPPMYINLGTTHKTHRGTGICRGIRNHQLVHRRCVIWFDGHMDGCLHWSISASSI